MGMDSKLQHLSELFTAIPAPLVVLNGDARIELINEEARLLFNLESANIHNRIGDLISCRNRKVTPQGCGYSQACQGCPFFRAIREASSHIDEPFQKKGLALIQRDRPPFILWFKFTVRTLTWGRESKLILSLGDLTDLKEKEEELIQQKAHFEHLFQHAPLAIAILDGENHIIDCNLRFTELFLFSLPEIKGKNIISLIVPEHLVEEATSISKTALQGRTVQRESIRKKKDGQVFPVLIIGTLITIKDKPYVYALYQDITAQKEMEGKVHTLLKQKDLLLKEVHHRIKNNLALMISLLSIQRASLRDPEAITAFMTYESQVRSIGLLYDKLYGSDSLQSLSLREYLTPLVEEIVSLFPKTRSLQTDLSIESIPMDPKTLSTLGIIVTELITNSIKHAFPDRQGGTITLIVRRQSETIQMEYRDNGIGMPLSTDLEQTNHFGMQLIDLLVQQLGGSHQRIAGQGACFLLQFPYISPSS